jgi:hypothetical protein
MARIRRRIAIAGSVALLAVGVLAQPVAALHKGATADCGSAGILTLKAQPNGAGFEAPPPGDVLRFEEGGTLSILVLQIDGQVVFDAAAVGRANNNIDEVTCSFELANGVPFVVTGIYTGR